MSERGNRIVPPPPAGWAETPDRTAGRRTGTATERASGRPLPASGVEASLRGWENLMREALAEARKALAAGEVPVGALVVNRQGEILGRGHNAPVSTHNPAAHAEIAALLEAAARKQNYRLGGCCLVVTLEPCLMCAGAAVQARVDGVVYGAADPRAGALQSRLEALDLPFHNHHPWHLGGILENECADLLRDFFATKR